MQMEYYSAIIKNEILQFETIWMDLDAAMQSEVSQQKNKYCVISFNMWNLKTSK